MSPGRIPPLLHHGGQSDSAGDTTLVGGEAAVAGSRAPHPPKRGTELMLLNVSPPLSPADAALSAPPAGKAVGTLARGYSPKKQTVVVV